MVASSFRSLRARLLSLTLIAALVTPLAPFPSTVLAEEYMTRGNFIRDAIQTLGLTPDDDIEAPTERIPPALLPYIGAALKRGALKIFGTSIAQEKTITRGEAVVVLMELQNLSSKNITAGKYSDVSPSSPYSKAVQLAIDRQWLKAYRPKIFGVARPLTARESTLLLKRVKNLPKPSENTDGSYSQTIKINLRPTEKTLPKDAILNTIWQILNNEYLYKEKINGEEAAYKAAEGLVQSLGDPYTVFMRPATNQNFITQIQGEVTGIGAQVEQKDGVLIIVSPLKGSPAEKAGLLPNDEIIAVDGASLAGLSFQDAVNKVRGPKGSTVKLKIRRSGSEMEISVQRDVVKVPEIEISFQGTIAVVKLHQFGQITDRDLRSLMGDVQKKNPTGVILDLRNNPGGLLHAADIVVSNFLPAGSPVANIVSSDKTTVEMTADPPTIATNVPLVVLVNKGSASASEIVAGALQDAKRAKIVGEQTFGKGTVQQVLQFTDGSSLKMTVAEWKTPAGRKIDGTGVTPDIVLAAGDRDEQMLKALDMLR